MSQREEALSKFLAFWLPVVWQLRADPKAIVQCPFYRSGPLSVTDVPCSRRWPSHPIAGWTICDQCHEKTADIPLVLRPPDNPPDTLDAWPDKS
jgi:hypothetical protein